MEGSNACIGGRNADMEGSNVIIYTTADGRTKVDATFCDETVWLTLDQMALLFQRDKSTISRHVKNVFTDGELVPDSVVAKFATTAADGKVYQVEHFSLDVIISVGYRVKSQRGVQFRIWATNLPLPSARRNRTIWMGSGCWRSGWNIGSLCKAAGI